MALFSNLFKLLQPTPAQPTPATVTPVHLPKIPAQSATQVAGRFTPTPTAQALLQPNQTPAQYLAALEQNQQSEDAIKTLAYGMPERESTWYACQSSQRVAGQLAPADKEALVAAEAWVKNPTPETQAAAAAAAAKTDFQGPGAWAAQAAAWSQSSSSALATPAAPSVNTASLAPQAAVGAVLLAAALENAAPMPPSPKLNLETSPLPAPEVPQAPVAAPAETAPAQLAEVTKMHQPYIDLGKDIAAGKNTWS